MGTDIFPQTATTQFNNTAFAGQVVDSWLGVDIESGSVSESAGVDAGLAVIYDSAPTLNPGWAQKVKYPTGAGDTVAGFTVYKPMKEPLTIPTTAPRFALNDTVDVLKKGRIAVLVQNTVTKGDPVYAWFSTGSTKGSIRNDAGSNQAVLVPGATVWQGASTGGYALIEVNLPAATAQVAGGAFTVTAVKTSAYSANVGELVQVDTTAGAVTVTLPTAVGIKGRQIKVFDQGGAAATHNITIATTSSQTFDPTSGNTISTNGQLKTYTSDGANWIVN